MPYNVSNADQAMFAMVTNWNAFVRERATNEDAFSHAEITSYSGGDWRVPTASSVLVTVADAAATLATVITLANQEINVLDVHFLDTYAHLAADTTNDMGLDDLASDASQSVTNTRLNAIKTACLAHVSQGGVHFHDDVTNTIAAANATDLASSITLANAIKVFLNAHIQQAPTTKLINIV